ncbi:MAG: DNA internalization-related competence protein ComEC/Rec2 [Gammaproteobacteria bacterium]|nr:DNA internalization-related competence protein ComEC/Rec2 [Gammaproteobacteria bacterium]
MRSGMAAFATGVIAVGFFHTLPGLDILLLFLLILLLLLFIGQKKSARPLLLFAGISLLFLAGVAWHVANAQQRLQQRLPLELEGVDFMVTGYVASLPETRGITRQFRFFIETGPVEYLGQKILLNYYGSKIIDARQRWKFQVRLKRPHGFANPGTFDYEAWLFQQGISGKGYVRENSANQFLGEGGFSVLGIRDDLRTQIVNLTAGFEQQAIILALTLGDRSLISNHQWQVFTDSGTNHLVVVSGLHIGFVAGLFYLSGCFLWRLMPITALRFPAQKAGALSALAGACIYSLGAGFSLPTQRALVMVAVFMLAKLLALPQAPSFSLLLALVVVLLLDPFAALGAGFWLSFLAVAGLLLVFAGEFQVGPESTSGKLWRKWGKSQLVVFIALLMPLTIWLGEFSLVSPIANIVAIPLVSWLIVPLCLLGTVVMGIWPDLGGLLFYCSDTLLGIMFVGLEWIANNNWSPGSWRVSVDFRLILLFSAVGCLLMLLPAFGSYRLLGMLLLMPLIFPRPDSRSNDVLELHVLDVGQGLAIIIRTANHVLVYDTGASFVGGFDSGAAIVGPVLTSMGITEVDLLIVSHADNDHAGGVHGLVQNIAVKNILTSIPESDPLVNAQPCRAGQKWSWDRVRFNILHPENPSGLSANNGSCVLQIQMGGHSILLPGDIEAPMEQRLLRQTKATLAGDILVAAHHGSNTSSTARLVNALQPQVVIFSAGYRSQFGHPTEAVQSRFRGIGSRLFNTSAAGMISVYLEQGIAQARVELYREQRPKYWH